MRERLSRVGRFIRSYSLDDLPNLLNILKGDLSIIGPRPTEPERVDLTSPIWQQILSARPGIISPAVIQLATQYNASPNSLKQQLELEYVQKRSLAYDLHLFRQALRGFYISRGNWKARGTPKTAIEYAQYQEKAVPVPEAPASHAHNYWQLGKWDQPDLSYVAAFVREFAHEWQAGEPQFFLVPCADSTLKAAIFVRVDETQSALTAPIGFQEIEWLVASTNRYVCLGCLLHLESATGQRFVFSTLLDVASHTVEAWLSTWRQNSETIVFFVGNDLTGIEYRRWGSDGGGREGAKAHAVRQWEEVKTRLQQSGFALENFAEESQLLRGALLGL